jgi:hypothetical protein
LGTREKQKAPENQPKELTPPKFDSNGDLSIESQIEVEEEIKGILKVQRHQYSNSFNKTEGITNTDSSMTF